jgi:hypothetical protein
MTSEEYDVLAPDAVRAAIGKRCGWSERETTEYYRHIEGGPKTYWHGPNGEQEQALPDYLNDLNAIHQASLATLKFCDKEGCKQCGRGTWGLYLRMLDEILDAQLSAGVIPFAMPVAAEAAVRAKALVLTLSAIDGDRYKQCIAWSFIAGNNYACFEMCCEEQRNACEKQQDEDISNAAKQTDDSA